MDLPDESNSWFVPTEKSLHSKAFGFSDFKIQLYKQIMQRLGIKDNMKLGAKVNLDLNLPLYLEEIKVVIEEHKFNEMKMITK